MPATLMALRDAGWRVVNVACGLGRPAQHQRRRAEVEEACRRAGFDLVTCDPPLALSAGDDLAAAEERAGRAARADARRVRTRSSSARRRRTTAITRTSSWAAPRAVRSRRAPGTPPPLWLWGVWADLPFPTLIVPFDRARLAEIQHALAAHESELARLPLDRMLEARAVLNAGVGEERVHGSGARGRSRRRVAELLTARPC